MRRRQRIAYLYLLPGFLVYLAFVLVPLAHTVELSFFEWDGISVGTWVGLDNYRRLLGDGTVLSSFAHAGVFLVFTSIVPVMLGLVLAAALSRHRLRGLAVFRTVLFLPQVIAMVVVGVAWRWMYTDDGVVNQLLHAVGLGSVSRAWLGDFTWALPAVGLVGTWVMYGLCMVLFLAGVQKIDTSLYEVARIDGAGPIREFLHVTLPGLRQEIAVALTITTIAALRNFDLVYVTTNGGPGNATTVPAVEIYRLGFREGDVGLACAVAVVLTLLIFTVVFTITRLAREER
ncbi:carbohydrate ABC transporter permease [Micromonospora sp. CPCC 206061]|uniref:carbohydrate ABC transporter permease n=1 Tax=Micromonospora sp. CPCC 206061 TaxID=3122410 RepID=UPI002FF2D039